MPFRGSYTSREQVCGLRIQLAGGLPDSADHYFYPGVSRRRSCAGWQIIDLPMMVVIFFAVARRNPISGCVTGAIIGLLQDALGGPAHPIGMYGITDTIIGYMASSLGVKIDVENPGIPIPDHVRVLCHPPGGVLRSGTWVAPAVAAMELEPRRHLGPGQRDGRRLRVSICWTASSNDEIETRGPDSAARLRRVTDSTDEFPRLTGEAVLPLQQYWRCTAIP